jgi:hypothetical protein
MGGDFAEERCAAMLSRALGLEKDIWWDAAIEKVQRLRKEHTALLAMIHKLLEYTDIEMRGTKEAEEEAYALLREIEGM